MSFEIIRQASQGMWADAHRPGGRERNMIQAEVIMAEMLALVAKDPIAAAGSWLGGMHLSKYWFLLSDADFAMSLRQHANNVLQRGEAQTKEQMAEMVRFLNETDEVVKSYANPYPYRFEIKDVLLDSKEILMQLVADEYFMGGPESTPFTPDAFVEKPVVPVDVFASTWRPDVNVQFSHLDGDCDSVTYNEGGPFRPKPAEGFREVVDG